MNGALNAEVFSARIQSVPLCLGAEELHANSGGGGSARTENSSNRRHVQANWKSILAKLLNSNRLNWLP